MVVAFAEATAVYSNYTGSLECSNIANGDDAGGLDAGGWEYQQCTQMPMPNNTRDTSMFVQSAWTNDDWTSYCQTKYNSTPSWDWAFENFGGYNFTQDFAGYSNIMFSNGDLDPWGGLGVTGWINHRVPYVWIKGGAHHIDLRTPNEADPADAVWARQQHEDLIT
jgi:hypothetical protein